MLSKGNKYRQMIQESTKRILPFPQVDNKGKKSTVILYCDIQLSSSYPFKQSQQIESNTSITHHITSQSSKQYPTALHNQWPHSCIGLVLCEHHQNNQTFYVHGTGTLLHNNLVFTSAQSVYCRRLNTQYTNIKFIVGVSGKKCSGIYNVKRVHYPKEYTMQEEYENYNFGVLQLYDDLSKSCGYVGWKTISDIKELDEYTKYGYISDNQEGSFKLKQITKNEISQQKYCSGSGVLVNKIENNYSGGIIQKKRGFKQQIFYIIFQQFTINFQQFNLIYVMVYGSLKITKISLFIFSEYFLEHGKNYINDLFQIFSFFNFPSAIFILICSSVIKVLQQYPSFLVQF